MAEICRLPKLAIMGLQHGTLKMAFDGAHKTAAPAAALKKESGDAAFLREVRAFLDEALTEDLRAAGRATTGTHSDIEACRLWHKRLYEKGWIAPAWPKAHGGTGWDARLRNVGPLLIEMGSEAQRARYLEPILSGAHLWCQGYSEAGAGSDLAALSMKAVREGDAYILNGTKIWTTGAHLATHMFALVRTASIGKPQEGITFLLIDMKSPGIEIRPIQTLSGEPEFNEVHFTDVRVPVCERVGEENEGWLVAKRLMQYARKSNTTTGLLRRTYRLAKELAARDGLEKDFAGAFAEAEIGLDALERAEEAANMEQPGALNSSMMKLLATELHQKLSALYLDLAGPGGLEALGPEEILKETATAPPLAHAGAKYFATRAASIYSGTNEVQRNILAASVLGLGKAV
jgi:acyl-CoA dehydrogenase